MIGSVASEPTNGTAGPRVVEERSPRSLLRDLVRCLYPGPEGFVEIRTVFPKEGGKTGARQEWIAVGDVEDRLLGEQWEVDTETARKNQQALYWSVLARRTKNGKAADVGPGQVVWADLDFKHNEDGEAGVRVAIDALVTTSGEPLLPSAVVHSGHGLQVYYFLDALTEPDLLSELSSYLHRTLTPKGENLSDKPRVLRIPRTWNMKDPAHPVLAKVEQCDPDRRYAPADFCTAEDRERAEEQAYDDLADVRSSADIPEERTPTLDAIFKAHPYVEDLWNGEGKIFWDCSRSGYDMSLARAVLKNGGTESDALAALYTRGSFKAKGERHVRRTVGRALESLRSEQAELLLYRADVVADLFTETAGRVVYWRAQHYLYERGSYRALSEPELRSRIVALVEDRGDWARVAKTKEEKQAAFFLPEFPTIPVVRREVVATSTEVREVLLQLQRDLVPDANEMPCWLDGVTDQPPAREILCCTNGLLHPRTGAIVPHTAGYFGIGRVGYAYDPNATAHRWRKFLGDLFADDKDAMNVLEELMGYYLLPDTSQHKIGLIVGPPRSGKGTIARVLRSLLGSTNVAGPTLSSLATNFGLWPLIDRRLAIISDARLGHGTNASAIVERLLAVSGEDAITVDRKNLVPWTGTLAARFLVLTNELPRLGDASGALVSRLVVVLLGRSWCGREDTTLTAQLLDELPGILVCAMAGYRRLLERGHFVQPESALDVLQELEDLNSPMAAFVRDWCDKDKNKTTTIATLYEAWRIFCQENGREHVGTVQSFGRDLRAACPDIVISRPRDKDKSRDKEDKSRPRHAKGIGLNADADSKVEAKRREEKRREERAEAYQKRWGS